jgi:hypothetical protein
MRPRGSGREAGILMGILVAMDAGVMPFNGSFAAFRGYHDPPVVIACLIAIAILIGAYSIPIARIVGVGITSRIRVISTIVGIV